MESISCRSDFHRWNSFNVESPQVQDLIFLSRITQRFSSKSRNSKEDKEPKAWRSFIFSTLIIRSFPHKKRTPRIGKTSHMRRQRKLRRQLFYRRYSYYPFNALLKKARASVRRSKLSQKRRLPKLISFPRTWYKGPPSWNKVTLIPLQSASWI